MLNKLVFQNLIFMDSETPYRAAYNGSKKFNQWDIPTANATGFGAAADDYMERGIDLNEILIRNKPATFFFRMNSDAMTEAGIYKGDVLVVDRSLRAINGKIVVAVLNGEMLVRRLEQHIRGIRLVPNSRLAPIEVDTSCSEFAVWGVVTFVIHQV